LCQDNDLTITGSTFQNNSINGGGGAINVQAGDVVIRDSFIIGNHATDSGGGIALRYGLLDLTNVRISDNSSQHGRGGGIILTGNGILTARQSEITANFADDYGGGIYLVGSCNLENTIVSNNRTNGFGGGMYASPGAYLLVDFPITLTDCSIINNSATYGGGVFTTGSHVSMFNSTLGSNSASDDGGGIYFYGGSLLKILTLHNSNVIHNVAGRSGGGILIPDGAAELVKSTISDNRAGLHGGGVSHSGPRLTIQDSAISGNSTRGNGGGVHAASHQLLITNSTISNNEANNNGGGIYVNEFYEPLNIARVSYSTFTANRANIDSTSGGAGGGVFIARGQLSLDHTIVAANFNTSAGPDLTGLLGTSISPRYSLIGNSANSGLTPSPPGMPDANGNRIGGANTGVINPLLGPLADNGGPTLTHALLPGSPAINAGDPTAVAGVNGVPLHDQRGAPYTRVFGGRIDMGAFEAQPTQPIAGDFNRDGSVDAADYIIWRKQLGTTVEPGTGADGNGDGVVDHSDHAIWMSNLGRSTPPALSAEPALAAGAGHFDGQSVGDEPPRTNDVKTVLVEPMQTSTRPAARARVSAKGVLTSAEHADQALLAWATSRSMRDVYPGRSSAATVAILDDSDDADTEVTAALDRVFDQLAAAM
jgi:hypothetical protein